MTLFVLVGVSSVSVGLCVQCVCWLVCPVCLLVGASGVSVGRCV